MYHKPKAEYPVILGCILLAGAIWLLNAFNKEYTTEIRYPVRFHFDKTRLTPVEELPTILEINVSGPGWSILKRTVGFNQSPVVINTNRFDGRRFITSRDLLPVFSQQLPELKVNFVVSDSIYVHLNRITSKKVRLVLDTSSFAIAEGKALGGAIYMKPDSMTITGAASLVQAFPNRLKVSLPIKMLKEDFEEPVDIDFSRFKLLRFSQKKVLVSIPITTFKEEKIKIPLRYVNFPEGLAFRKDSTMSIRLLLDQEELDSIRLDSVYFLVDYAKAENGLVKMKVKNLPRQAKLGQNGPFYFLIHEN